MPFSAFEYVNSTLIYLSNENSNIDKDELIMYLSSVEEAIFIIKNLLLERNL